MTLLLLPEVFELLSFGFGKGELFASDVDISEFHELLILFFAQLEAGNGQITLIFVTSGVNDLDLIKSFFDCLFNVLPADLIFYISFFIDIGSLKMHNERVFKILGHKNNSALLISLDHVFLLLDFAFLLSTVSGLLVISLSISLLKTSSLLWHLLIILSSDLAAISTCFD